jgi:hypothetical protein
MRYAINDERVINAQLETQPKSLEYDDAAQSLRVQKIRGPPEERLPPNAKIPEEITHILSRQV